MSRLCIILLIAVASVANRNPSLPISSVKLITCDPSKRLFSYLFFPEPHNNVLWVHIPVWHGMAHYVAFCTKTALLRVSHGMLLLYVCRYVSVTRARFFV